MPRINAARSTFLDRSLKIKQWLAPQTRYYEELRRLKGETIRITMKRDAYKHQSSIHCDVYHAGTNKWNSLCSLPVALHGDWWLKMNPYARLTEEEVLRFCAPLANELVAEAELILP